MQVPFFRPSLGSREIDAVVETLRSGWLTTGPQTKSFEERFAASIGAAHGVALNSCTAALHLALEAVGLKRGELVLVPAMTFAATAEVVRYFDAVPVFVDADPATLCLDPPSLERTLRALAAGEPTAGLRPPYGRPRAVIPMHYGGQMADMAALAGIAKRFELSVIEDAAHAFPAAFRVDARSPWQSVGALSDIACFSFYANKCITTGEGGMATTDRADYAERMRIMSLHGMSKDAWKRFSSAGAWYYEIVAPGFKYNMTDVAAAIGLGQLERAEAMSEERRRIAHRYLQGLAEFDWLSLPVELSDRRHAWHLFQIQLELGRLSIDRAEFITQLKEHGISTSVHWMPLHMQPYYVETYGYSTGIFPIAESAWPRLISLPIFPGMTEAEQEHVIRAVRDVGQRYLRS